MELKAYFETTQGTGVLATADAQGKVDAAVYSRPHVMEDGTLAFITRDRLTHHNLQSNPQATYLFIENVPGYQGKRLFMTKVREEQDPVKIKALKRRQYADDDLEQKFLVYFKVVQELPLIGSGPK
jgi:ribosomal protein L25 (general stress protein Ctc)